MNCSNTLDPYPQGRMKERESQPVDAQITRSLEWELLLPPVEDLTPIHQSLITPGIASALGITPTKCSTLFVSEPGSEFELLKLFPEKSDSEGCRVRKRADSEDAAGGSDEWNSGGDESGSSSRATKRPRLVWTPELHQRFVDVIGELGVDKAVPKTIMEMMNVDGLTRENVASHLQKYRLYLKKAEGITPEMNSNSNPISISSTSSGGRSASTLECGNSVFGSIMPFNSMAMNMMSLPLPSMLGGLGAGSLSFGYDSYEGEHMGLGLAPDGSRKPAYCSMDSGGFNSSLFWNRHGG